MAYNSYTTQELVDDIILYSHMPIGNSTFTPTQILRLAIYELQTSIMKNMLSTRGGYYMTYQDYPIVDDGLYVIPSQAIAGALANVELVQTPTIIPVNQIEESEQFSTNSPTATSYGFFMKGNYVQILPTPNVGVARLWFFQRPSVLVMPYQCAQITNIAGDVVSVSALPTTFQVGSAIDEVGDQPPFNIAGEGNILSISGTDVTLDYVDPTLGVGDWLALDQQTCIPQIPVEYRILLIQRVTMKIYELQGYLDKYQTAKASMEEYMKDTLTLITPRVKSQTKIITPVNGGFLAGNGNRMTNFPAGRIP